MFQLILRACQDLAARSRKLPAGPIDVERQHRERGAIGIRLAPFALLGGSLQRRRDFLGIAQAEHALFQVERIARFGHVPRPAPAAALWPHFSAARGFSSHLFFWWFSSLLF